MPCRILQAESMLGVFLQQLAACLACPRVSEKLTDVRDALEDLAKETVGAMKLTEDYSTCRDSCHTHAHTCLLHSVCVCAEKVYMPQSKQC